MLDANYTGWVDHVGWGKRVGSDPNRVWIELSESFEWGQPILPPGFLPSRPFIWLYEWNLNLNFQVQAHLRLLQPINHFLCMINQSRRGMHECNRWNKRRRRSCVNWRHNWWIWMCEIQHTARPENYMRLPLLPYLSHISDIGLSQESWYFFARNPHSSRSSLWIIVEY